MNFCWLNRGLNAVFFDYYIPGITNPNTNEHLRSEPTTIERRRSNISIQRYELMGKRTNKEQNGGGGGGGGGSRNRRP